MATRKVPSTLPFISKASEHSHRSNQHGIMNSSFSNLSAFATPAVARPYAYLYEELCRYFLGWYLPVAIIIGSLGTLFSLFFLFCSKLFQSSMLLWLSSICIGDFLILILEGMWILLKVWFKYDVRDQNDVICKLHKASSNYALYWSAYMQSALSVQRAYLVFKPLHARSRGGMSKKHITAWILITIALFVPITPYLIFWRIIHGDCDPTDTDIFYLTTLCDLIIWGIIPLLSMTISTVVICLNMARAGNRFSSREPSTKKRTNKFSIISEPNFSALMRKRGASTPSISFASAKSKDDAPRLSGRFIQELNQEQALARSDSSKDMVRNSQPSEITSRRHNGGDNFGHVTRLLICMNIAYMASTFPLLIFLMFRNFSGVEVNPDVHRFFYYLLRSLCFLNSCTNWIFYCLVGKLFRQEVKHIIKMCFGLEERHRCRNSSNYSAKLLAPAILTAPSPMVNRQTSPKKRLRAVSAIELQGAVVKVPAR